MDLHDLLKVMAQCDFKSQISWLKVHCLRQFKLNFNHQYRDVTCSHHPTSNDLGVDGGIVAVVET